MQSITNEILGIEPKPKKEVNNDNNTNINTPIIPQYPLSLREEASSSALSKIKQLRESFSSAVHKAIPENDNIPALSTTRTSSNNTNKDTYVPQRTAMKVPSNYIINDNTSNHEYNNISNAYTEEKISSSSQPIIEVNKDDNIYNNQNDNTDNCFETDDNSKATTDINNHDDDDDDNIIDIKDIISNTNSNITLKPAFTDEVDLSGKFASGSMKGAIKSTTVSNDYKHHVNASLDLSNLSLHKFKELTGQY